MLSTCQKDQQDRNARERGTQVTATDKSEDPAKTDEQGTPKSRESRDDGRTSQGKSTTLIAPRSPTRRTFPGVAKGLVEIHTREMKWVIRPPLAKDVSLPPIKDLPPTHS